MSCGACYVSRLQLGEVVNKVSAQNPKVPRELFLSQEGIDELSRRYPGVYSQLRSEMGVRGIKPPESYAEIDGQILRMSNETIRRINDRRGIRWFSWSDMEVPHSLDAMQATLESAIKRAKGYAYTKVPDFTELMGNTNLMINQSTMPKGATGLVKGKLVWDDIEGMPINKALALRNKYPDTVGIELMGVSDDQIRLALSDPRVDTVIPFHRSGLSSELRERYVQKGWQDYQNFSEEKMRGTRSAVPPQVKQELDWYTLRNRYPDLSSHELAWVYLQRCDRLGVTPKFPMFQEEPNYYKLLVDMKQYNHITGLKIVQRPLAPNFAMDFINQMIGKYARGKWSPYRTEKKRRFPPPSLTGSRIGAYAFRPVLGSP